MKTLQVIRICLLQDGTVQYLPLYEGEEDCRDPLQPEEALHAITGGNVPFEIATTDPNDQRRHTYETLFRHPNGSTTTTVTLQRV